MKPVYLDCNASTPLDPKVRQVLLHYLDEDFGNEGSRTHEFGVRAKQAVQLARDRVGSLVGASREEVVFTSGATESNNIAIFGMRASAKAANKLHFITTQIEHKAVLEPFQVLEQEGFRVTRLPVSSSGWVDPEDLRRALTSDTMLVSIMHVNNETGIVQPIDALAEVLREHSAYFHTDAAQGFGKELDSLRNKRIDLLSVSGHKLFAPKGVGALIARKRGYEKPPLGPLLHGGGQERGLRPGTLPVALVAALGEACRLAEDEHAARKTACLRFRKELLDALLPLGARLTGDQSRASPHAVNLSFPGLDSEALMVALKDLIAISNGSACTSSSYSPSHVLKAMGMSDDSASQCVRISWYHATPSIDLDEITGRLIAIR